MAIPILKKSKNIDIGQYYDSLIDKHGADSPMASDASSQESLEARWKVLSEIGDLNGKSILDIGCGTGGLGRYLKYTLNLDVDYTGIDLSKRAVEEGKKITPAPINLIQVDVCDYKPMDVMSGKNKQYDICLSQGLFYKLPNTSEGIKKVFGLIGDMVRLSRQAIGFTSVCEVPFGFSEHELRIDTIAVLKQLRNLTPFIILRTDYWPGDACYYLFKNKQGDN